MFDLVNYIKETHKEGNRLHVERNQQPTEPLIPSPQSSTEINNSNDPTVGIFQPNQQNNVRPGIVPLSSVTQSYDGRNNIQQVNASPDENKINITAALLTLVLYLCSISIVVYGAIHMKDCPAQNMIAISYIVMGCLLLFSRILSSPEECRDIFNKERNTTFVPQTFCRMCFNLILQISIMCFFFALCYWVFHINSDTTEGSPNYCEKEFYKQTYYGCIVALSFLGFVFVLTCCGLCIVCCRSG